jgi:copper chaperone CopZ
MKHQARPDKHSTVTLNISDLRCQSCVQRVEASLSYLSGVTDAKVSITEKKVYISY